MGRVRFLLKVEELLENIAQLLLYLFLIVLAAGLVVLLIVPALFWKIYVSLSNENRKARDIMQGTAMFFKAIAISIDVFGGVAFSGMFNNLLLVNQIYRFGSPYETISEVLGWAQYYNDLTYTGKLLVKVLDWLDENHCEKTRVLGLTLAKHKISL